METRDIFQEKARKTLDFIFDSVNAMEDRIENFSDEIRFRYAPQLEALKLKKTELEKDFHELMDATSESWEDAKEGFEKSSEIMHHQMEKIREHFRKHD